jgi:predicted CXXCH cytochrome family protein
MYDSEYLQRFNYEIPTELGVYPSTGYRSRLCLSCHDGTVAIGNVYVLRGTPLISPINMLGVVSNGTIPTTSPSYLGTDLTNDHPVAIKYDTGKSILFGSGVRSIELNTTAPPINPKPYENVKLFSPAPGYVECPSCHDPHTENEQFLVIWDTNLATTIGNLCTTCHDKTNWTSGIHNISGASYTGTDVLNAYGANTITSLDCSNCHQSHGGQGSPYWYILRQVEETTCFKGAASLTSDAPCHGTGSASGGKIIETLFSRSYKHPVTTITGKHTNLDVLDPSYVDWTANKHAECVDCHNSHQAKNIPERVPPSSWYPTTVDGNSNRVSKSGALTGVTGVEPNTEPSTFSPPTLFTTYNEADFEYQMCFICHSYYALQDIDGVTTFTTNSGILVTDQSMEFSQGIKSVHPVRFALNSQTGSSDPRPLNIAQMSTPWDSNCSTSPPSGGTNYCGINTMYCSDCHGADNESSTDSKGPHGSSYKYMLKGARKYWPTKSDGVTLWKLSDLGGADAGSNLFCVNCHPNNRNLNNAHSENDHWDGTLIPAMACVECHVAVPHGSKRSRLIGYTSDVNPYNYSNNLQITEFVKATGANSFNNYVANSCQAACHAIHSAAVPGAEP